jgi:hypothetical protein
MGYDRMADRELKQHVRRDLYLLILRAIAMFIMAAHGVYFILVPLMALVLSYLEIWPERAIGAVFGDPSRLWEYDPPAIPHQSDDCHDVSRRASFHCDSLWLLLPGFRMLCGSQ